MKVAALNALHQMDAARARPVLRRVLARRDAASVCLRRKAVFLVAQQQAERHRRHPAGIGPHRPGSGGAAAGGLLALPGGDRSRGEGPGFDSPLLQGPGDPGQGGVRALAARQRAAQQALRTYAERGEVPEAAREKAIFWLGQAGRTENAAFLRSLYGRLKSEDLKKKVVFSLSQMGGTENGKWLLGLGARSGPGPRDAKAGALLGRAGRRTHRGAHRAVCHTWPTRRCGSS